MASTEYIRQYMREYRQGKRRGPRKRVPGSHGWLREMRRLGRVMQLPGSHLANEYVAIAKSDADAIEDPIGPQEVPYGMTVCPRCDILTRRRDVCGFCAGELVRAGA